MSLDWRIGLAVKPAMRDDKYHGCIGVVRSVNGADVTIEILSSPGPISYTGLKIVADLRQWITA